MPNHLITENSPYLLQHAHNPVDWYPWGEPALARARAEDKPIFLSIGYAACHWCHVMAHESFESPATAAIMNRHFINIKVDREERPDLDSIYMQAVVAMTGQGGWPMSVFLTPEGVPFYGGTYFPPQRRYNLLSFSEILLTIARLWREERPRLLESSRQLGAHLRQSAVVSTGPTDSLPDLDRAVSNLVQSYDREHGGWGQAPKFPQPMTIDFLLRRATRGDHQARDLALHALRAMARGGMYDLVGGGFARYSTDNLWRTPHFEKMLYDNAQLALAYLHGWLVSGEIALRRVCEETLDFVLREMTHPQGGFYSSLDADSEGEEGKFYLWTPDQITAALDPDAAALVIAAYGVTAGGNFEAKNILQRVRSDDSLGAQFNLPPGEIPARLEQAHRQLLQARSNRPRPGCDDKILTAWNGLMLAALAEAGRYLKRPDYLEAARRNARFLLDHMLVEGRLLRSWRAGQTRHPAYLEDHAALILGLLALYQSDPDPAWYAAATRLVGEMLVHFGDPDGGFFDTGDEHEPLLLRPKDLQDNATPSGGALVACALLQLAAYEGRADLRERAETMLGGLQETLSSYPTAFAQWLQAADFACGPIHEVAVVGDPHDPQTQALLAALWQEYRPRLVSASAQLPLAPGSPALLADRLQHAGRPTAYVCQNFACRLPVHTAGELMVQLG